MAATSLLDVLVSKKNIYIYHFYRVSSSSNGRNIITRHFIYERASSLRLISEMKMFPKVSPPKDGPPTPLTSN